ncbi:SAM-dependent methyltransferase, partial [Streptomyces sp. 2MCAF27]
VLAAGLGGAVLARALAGHFTEARQALADPAGRWGAGDPMPRRFTPEQLTGLIAAAGLEVGPVHGVRVFAELPAFHSVATQLHVLAAGLGGAVLARALAGHFTEARQALADPAGRWGAGDPMPRRFTPEQLTGLIAAAGLEVGPVHGVRVFADLVPGVLVDTEPDALDALLQLEAAAAELPAFHSVATQLHV